MLARAVDDPQLSKTIRKSARGDPRGRCRLSFFALEYDKRHITRGSHMKMTNAVAIFAAVMDTEQFGARCIGVRMAYKRILVPIDGTPTSNRGLREAVGFAKAQKARLQLVHVVDVHNAMLTGLSGGAAVTDIAAALEERGRRLVEKAVALVRKSGLACETVLLESLSGPAAEPIVRQARKWRADLIVIGTHGRRGLKRLVMGSDAEQIVRNAPAPVLLIRGGLR